MEKLKEITKSFIHTGRIQIPEDSNDFQTLSAGMIWALYLKVRNPSHPLLTQP